MLVNYLLILDSFSIMIVRLICLFIRVIFGCLGIFIISLLFICIVFFIVLVGEARFSIWFLWSVGFRFRLFFLLIVIEIRFFRFLGFRAYLIILGFGLIDWLG
jgi:hypothetical protein